MDSTEAAGGSNGRLFSKPRVPTKDELSPGVHGVGAGGLLLMPRAAKSGSKPLIVVLHGAGGDADQALRYFDPHAEELGGLLLALKSRGATWDAIRGGFGVDVAELDVALAEVFDRFQVDSARVAISGFSDGATYALSLGIINGDLFKEIIAFSPGFIISSARKPLGAPRIFISHGTEDRVLPITQTSRRLTPLLRKAGYEVDYREFSGGHTIPRAMARAAVLKMQMSFTQDGGRVSCQSGSTLGIDSSRRSSS
jgi:phospholipase/carboxylesterase